MCCSGCATRRGNGPLVSDLGNGTAEYRGIQEEQRGRETDLAITGKGIEDESRELRIQIGEIGTGIGELEQSIIRSAGNEQSIDGILQSVRARKLDPALYEEWRNHGSAGGSVSGDREGGEI
jgi:hypothetical protein